MKLQYKITAYIILSLGTLASLYDVWVLASGGVSVSNVMTDAIAHYPVVTFTLGFICGHWIGAIKYNYNV